MYAYAHRVFSRSTSLPFGTPGCDVSLNMRKIRTTLSAEEAVWLMPTPPNEQDRVAFSALFDFYGPRIKSFMMRSGFPSSAAEEFVQETMLLVWKKASSFDASRAGAATWIFTIARNLLTACDAKVGHKFNASRSIHRTSRRSPRQARRS